MLCTCRLGKIIQLQLPLETVSALTIRKKISHGYEASITALLTEKNKKAYFKIHYQNEHLFIQPQRLGIISPIIF